MRLKDVKDPNKVDFRLMPREQRLPVCVAFGTDPHDATIRLADSSSTGQADLKIQGTVSLTGAGGVVFAGCTVGSCWLWG